MPRLSVQAFALASSVVLMITAGCAFPGLPAPPTVAPTATPTLPPADRVASAFLQAWQQADYPMMYSLLSPAAQGMYPEDLFDSAYAHALEEAAVWTVAPRVLAAYQSGTHAEVSFVTRFETALFGDLEVHNQMPLSYVQGRWGVDWSPSLILPQLRDNTHVRLTTQVPSRGNIYDRNGLGLAVQGEMVEVGVVPGQMQNEAAALARLGAALGQEPATLQSRYEGVNRNWYVPLGQIDPQTAQTHYDALSSTPGVELRQLWMRSYRQEQLAPHVVGVVGPIPHEEVDLWRDRGYRGDELVGLMGLERWGEEHLAGQWGARLEVVTTNGQQVALVAEKPPKESSSVYTTFDREFQRQVQDILGQRVGAIAVLEANTGRVLALATYPSFDPNVFASGISQQEWVSLQRDVSRPLVNRSTQGRYPAGSVFKVVTMAAGMGAAGLQADSTFLCQGVWTGLGADLPKVCWLGSGHGVIPLSKALTVSCDITFYQVGLLLNEHSPELLPSYARDFGFGLPTGIQVEEDPGLVPNPQWKMQAKGEGWAPGDSVNLAIGQSELAVSPLQVASMLAAVGNGGTLYRVSVVEMVASDPSVPEWSFEPEVLTELPVEDGALGVIQASLHRVTSSAEGTAYEAFAGFGLPVAGKTGTAESGREEPHAWFAGYAPADEPEIAIAVIVEHSGTGGEYAAPLLRQVVDAYFAKFSQAAIVHSPSTAATRIP